MNRLTCQQVLAVALALALPGLSWANMSNTASIAYKDAAGNSYGPTASNTVTVTVTEVPVITSATTASGDLGVAFSYQITTSTGSAATSYNATGLPNGLTVNTTSGLISGTPTVAGTSSVTLSATNAAGMGTATLALTIRAAAAMTLTKSANPASAVSGGTVTFTIQYQNTSSGAASNVVITDVVPTGSTLVSGSISNGGTASGNTITWNLGTVAANASGSVSFQVTAN